MIFTFLTSFSKMGYRITYEGKTLKFSTIHVYLKFY